MGIGKRIKEARNALNMTQEELAKLLGVTKGAVANYENETSHPKEPIMYKMFDALSVDANYLFQDVVNIPKKVNDVTFSEFELIKKYRELDTHGKELIDIILDKEHIPVSYTHLYAFILNILIGVYTTRFIYCTLSAFLIMNAPFSNSILISQYPSLLRISFSQIFRPFLSVSPVPIKTSLWRRFP